MYFSEIRYIAIIVGCRKKIIDFLNNSNNEAEQAAQKNFIHIW